MDNLPKGTLIFVGTVLLSLVGFFIRSYYTDSKQLYEEINKTQLDILQKQSVIVTQLEYLSATLNSQTKQVSDLAIRTNTLEIKIANLEKEKCKYGIQ